MLTIDKEINNLRNIPGVGPYVAIVLERIQGAVNGLANNLAADPTQLKEAPPPVQALTIKANNGDVHAVITDNSAVQKGVHYFVEYSSEPNFLQPHVIHLGTSRSAAPFRLPAMDDSGNAQSFYFRAYSQYPGGHPGKPIYFGGTAPSAVNPGGTTQLSLIPSTGSGTAQSTGQQGGSGFGKVLYRPVLTPTEKATL